MNQTHDSTTLPTPVGQEKSATCAAASTLTPSLAATENGSSHEPHTKVEEHDAGEGLIVDDLIDGEMPADIVLARGGTLEAVLAIRARYGIGNVEDLPSCQKKRLRRSAEYAKTCPDASVAKLAHLLNESEHNVATALVYYGLRVPKKVQQFSATAREEIVASFKMGEPIRALAKQYAEPTSAIRAVLVAARLLPELYPAMPVSAQQFAVSVYPTKSQAEIGRAIGFSAPAVRKVILRHGGTLAPVGDIHRVYSYRLDALKLWDADAAPNETRYWLGFLWADAHLLKTRTAVKIALAATDVDHLKWLQAYLGTDSPIRKYEAKLKGKVFPMAALQCCHPQIIHNLEESGFAAGERYYTMADTPVPDALVKDPHFWRGYIDGNGSLPSRTERARDLVVSLLTPLAKLRDTFEQMLRVVVPGVRQTRTSWHPACAKAWRRQLSGYGARELVRWLYFSAAGQAYEPVLPRKLESAKRVVMVAVKNGARRLTDEQVRELRRKRTAGFTLRELAEEYGIPISHVHLIVKRVCYRDVS